MFLSPHTGIPAWQLIATCFVLFFFGYSTIGFWFGPYAHTSKARYPASLTTIFSENTIDALSRDARLHEALLSFAEVVAQSSTELGERFSSESLKSLGSDLTHSASHLRTTQERRRQTKGEVPSGVQDAFEELLGEGTANTSALGGLIGRISATAMSSLSTPALFLGIGLGMGTSNGFNLTDSDTANVQATKVASAFNSSATGLNLVARNVGSGLAEQMVPCFNISNVSLGRAAFALASGIGNATARGLNLTQERFSPSDDSSLEALAGNMGLGLAIPIASRFNLQSMFQKLGSGIDTSNLMQQLPELASAAGMGLGEGAKTALGLAVETSATTSLQKRQQESTTADSNITGIVKQLTQGLSESFLKGSDLTKLKLSSGGLDVAGMLDFSDVLGPIAAGAGAGIGMGVAVGLNLRSADAVVTIGGPMTGSEQKSAETAQGFTQNLVVNLLSNSTAIQQARQYISKNPPQAFRKLDPAKTAEGFARGTVEGIMSAFSSVGGLKNLITGNISADALENVPALGPSKFDDSVNGSAVGFARGFMGEATILIAEVVRNMSQSAQNTTDTSTVRKSIENRQSGSEDAASSPSLVTRQTMNIVGSQFPLAIDAATAQTSGQKLLDALTCQGIGGVASVGFAVLNSNKGVMEMVRTGAPLDPIVLQTLPDGPITLSSEGNNFQVVVKDASLEINGLAVVPFAVLTALHVLFSFLAFLIFLPVYLILGVIWRFSVLTGHPVSEVKNRKWRLGFLVAFALFALAGIVLGIVGMGAASHFRDVHGIVGLITLALILPTVGVTVARLRTTLPHPSSASFAGIRAPVALAKTPQRIYLISGTLTQLVLALGQFTFVQGFSTLRAISLCIVDAILTSNAVAALMSFVLMVQIGATAVIGLRAWLEQHIAKREAAGMAQVPVTTMAEQRRKSSLRTFGFDRKDAPPALDLSGARPPFGQRKTDELKGFEDGAISAPFNVRKEGSQESPFADPSPYYQNPVLSPDEQRDRDTRRTYNPKIGGYQYDTDDQNQFFSINAGFQRPSSYQSASSRYTVARPDSDVFALSRLGVSGGPQRQDVTTQDLFPPPWNLTAKSMSSVYSRPFDGKAPVRETVVEFDRGPGGTIRRV